MQQHEREWGQACVHGRMGVIIIKQESENRTGFSRISPCAETHEGATQGRCPPEADQTQWWGWAGNRPVWTSQNVGS